jgi:3D (Asp-Asp-Asp) domain-containing protein
MQVALSAVPPPSQALSDRAAGPGIPMIATAYTAGCRGCSASGRTALGYHAGYGIVSVDPSVIRLGSRLYIPGYGEAIAGDTGGNIKGNRIDLGFNSYRDAIQFGRREITVYLLQP